MRCTGLLCLFASFLRELDFWQQALENTAVRKSTLRQWLRNSSSRESLQVQYLKLCIPLWLSLHILLWMNVLNIRDRKRTSLFFLSCGLFKHIFQVCCVLNFLRSQTYFPFSSHS